MSDKVKLSRRRLFGAGAIVGAGALLPGTAASADTKYSNRTGDPLLPEGRIGLMLYTVRDQIESKGFAKTFEAVADMGYNAVEFAGYSQGTGDITFRQLRNLLDANGLKAVGSHGNLDEAAIDAAVKLGMPYTGTAFEVPEYGTTRAGWEQLAEDYNAFGRKAARQGVKGYVHLHGPAYGPTSDEPDKRGLDVLLANTDPDVFNFQMDIYWAYFFRATFPGYDPIDWVKEHRNRFPLFHVKDGTRDEGGNINGITDVGQGNVPFERFFSAAGKPFSSWYLNERDNASEHARGSFCSAQCSYLYMRYGLRR